MVSIRFRISSQRVFGLTASSIPDILPPMDTTFPTLYKLTSTGKVQMWQISVAPDDPQSAYPAAVIHTTYGLLDGKKQKAHELIREGKNIGKANETTPLEQAELEAKSQWEKKAKKGYVQNIEDAQEKKVDTSFVAGGISPMLAHSFDKQGHKISYPAYIQPKLDGHRCIAELDGDNVALWSRTQKRINSLPHIENALKGLFGYMHVYLDGELYNHEYRENFEELTSKIRQSGVMPGHEVVQYWIYDVVIDGGFESRYSVLKGLEKAIKELGLENILVVVPTEMVSTEDEVANVMSTYVDDYGFEGAMLRNAKGTYKKNGRSYDLQKVKTFVDSEFPVMAIEEGKGKMAGKAMFVCELPDGNTFRVKMVGALDDLTEYYNNPEPWIGRDLTVKYQGLSQYGVPRFPVALRFREDI